MQVLITGVAGFVGSHIARELLDRGHQVLGIDSLSDYYDVSLKKGNLEALVGPDFRFVRGDLNEVDLTSLVRGVDVVFHEAGQPGVRKSWGDDFSVYSEANVNATQRLLEAVLACGQVSRFVYASSSSVYGEASAFPTSESAPTTPMSPYGVTKLAGEHLCSLYARNFGVPTVSLRYFTVYGPGQRPDMAFTRFVKAAVCGDEIHIYGDGQQVRDFTYIDDVVGANLAAMSAPVEPGSVYNIAGGGHSSIAEVLALLDSMADRPLNVVHYPTVAGDVARTGADTTRARTDLGWVPAVGLAEGLRAQYEWARERFGQAAPRARSRSAAVA